MKRAYWYHLSQRFVGERRVLAPREMPQYRDETGVPRICVAPSVASCLSARVFLGDVLIYRTAKRVVPVEPWDVWDALITGERWLLAPTRMLLVAVLPGAIARESCAGVVAHLKAGHSMSARVRVEALRQAVSVLRRDHPAREHRPAIDWWRESDPGFCEDVLGWLAQRQDNQAEEAA